MPKHKPPLSPICSRCLRNPRLKTHTSYCRECLKEYDRERQDKRTATEKHLALLQATGRFY